MRDFWGFHIDTVVICMDHKHEMETTTNQRGLGLTLKGSSSPNIWILFKHKNAHNYPSKSQMKTPMDLQIIQNQRSDGRKGLICFDIVAEMWNKQNGNDHHASAR